MNAVTLDKLKASRDGGFFIRSMGRVFYFTVFFWKEECEGGKGYEVEGVCEALFFGFLVGKLLFLFPLEAAKA